jgi:F420-dependent oxidoreductase-like protein
MDLRIFCEPQQGASYEQILALALATEEGGFNAFFRSDHYLKMGAVSGLPGPTDAWITLAALARDTTSVRLGTLLSSATFRLPGPLAISVAEVDALSHGRVELGLGAGWFEEEHLAYGVPFPSVAERFDKLEEQLSIITGLWETPADETFSFTGAHYSLHQSPALPKPVQKPRPPIIVGGHGAKRTPALAARFADEYNIPFASLEFCETQIQRVDEACRAANREPDSLLRSVALVSCCGRDDNEVERRASAIGRDVDELKVNGLGGRPSEVIDRIGAFAQLGITRIYLQILDIEDLDHVALLAADVKSALR